MLTMKSRKIDLISGYFEIQVNSLCNYYNHHNNFFNNIVPDIALNKNQNSFDLESMLDNETLKKQRVLLIS